jgi:hypothetical protein
VRACSKLEGTAVRGGHVRLLHHLLGEGLVELEPGAVAARAEDAPARRLELVDDSLGERSLGADHDQVNLVSVEPRAQEEALAGRERRGAGLAERAQACVRVLLHPELPEARGLRELPGEGMLAPAASDEEHVAG